MTKINSPEIRPETMIRPSGWLELNLKEIWIYRELLFFLVWRDIKVKYKQSVIGICWIAFKPIVLVAIYTILFGKLLKVPSEGVPYPLFVFTGQIPWMYFSAALAGSAASLITNRNLVTKIYFPRLTIPVSACLSAMADFIVFSVLMLFLMIYYAIIPDFKILLAPFFLFGVFIAALGPGLLLGALNVRFRDFGHAVPFIIQIGFYLTPVIYPLSFIPDKYRYLLYFNPMAGFIDAFRACFLPGKEFDFSGISSASAVSLIFLIIGLVVFKKSEQTFADVI